MRIMLSLLVGLALWAQEPQIGPGTAGRIRKGAALPAACAVGEVFYKTAATAGQYNCTAANTWTLVVTSGGNAATATALAGGAAGQYPYQTATGATGFRTPNTPNGPVVLDASGNATIGTTVLCANPVSVAGTSLTLSSTHNGCLINFSNAAAVTVTVPAGLPVGFTATLVQLGAGIVSPVADGVTFVTSAATAGAGTSVSLLATSADSYVMSSTTQIPTVATASVLKGLNGNAVAAGSQDVAGLLGAGTCTASIQPSGVLLLSCAAAQNLLKWSEDITQAGGWSVVSTTRTAADTITVTASGTNNIYSAGITVTPGASYIFSWDAKLGTLANPKYSIYDYTHDAFVAQSVPYAHRINANEYSRVVVPFTAPALCTTVMVYMSHDSTDTGTLFVRRMQVNAGAAPKPYVATTTDIVP